MAHTVAARVGGEQRGLLAAAIAQPDRLKTCGDARLGAHHELLLSYGCHAGGVTTTPRHQCASIAESATGGAKC
jgi:hypothetical protein